MKSACLSVQARYLRERAAFRTTATLSPLFFELNTGFGRQLALGDVVITKFSTYLLTLHAELEYNARHPPQDPTAPSPSPRAPPRSSPSPRSRSPQTVSRSYHPTPHNQHTAKPAIGALTKTRRPPNVLSSQIAHAMYPAHSHARGLLASASLTTERAKTRGAMVAPVVLTRLAW